MQDPSLCQTMDGSVGVPEGAVPLALFHHVIRGSRLTLSGPQALHQRMIIAQRTLFNSVLGK